MSITDELREWNDNTTILPLARRQLLDAIADRIDAEYQKAEDEWKAKGGQSWLHGYEECRLELMEGNEVIAASLEEAGWVRLPLDADGVPIHIGDELDGYGYPHGGAYCKAIVNKFMILAGPKGSSYRTWLMWEAKEVRHHHEPTIEDVLREFGEKYCDTIAGSTEESELFAEYAAKLQLRGYGND